MVRRGRAQRVLALLVATLVGGGTLVAGARPAAAAGVPGAVQDGVSVSVRSFVGPETPLYTLDLEFTLSGAVECPGDLNFLIGFFEPVRVDLQTTKDGQLVDCQAGDIANEKQYASTRVYKWGADGGELEPEADAPAFAEVRYGHTSASDARFQRYPTDSEWIDVPPSPVWVALGDGYSSQLLQEDDTCTDLATCTRDTTSWAEKALTALNSKVRGAWKMAFVSYAEADARLVDLVAQADQAVLEQLLQGHEGSWNTVSVTGGLLDAGLSGLEDGSILDEYYDGPGSFGGAAAAEEWYFQVPEGAGGTFTVTIDGQTTDPVTVTSGAASNWDALLAAVNALDLGTGGANLDGGSFTSAADSGDGTDWYYLQFSMAVGDLTEITVDASGMGLGAIEPVNWTDYSAGSGASVEPWNVADGSENPCPAYEEVADRITAWSAAQTSAMDDVVDLVTSNDQNVTIVQLLYPKLGEVSQDYVGADGNPATFVNACAPAADAAIGALNDAIDLSGTNRVHVLDLSAATADGGFGELTTGELLADAELGTLDRTEAYLQLTRPFGYPYPSDSGKNRAGETAFSKLLLPLLGGDPPDLWPTYAQVPTSGWYANDVSIRWQAIDPDTGVVIEGFPTDLVAAAEGSLAHWSPDVYGNGIDGACDADGCTPRQSVVLSIDKTAPAIRAVPDRAPDATDGTNQWYNEPVTVTWEYVHDWVNVENPAKGGQKVNDASGFLDQPQFVETYPLDGATSMYRETVNPAATMCDRAGNCATAPIRLNIDNVDPTSTPVITSTPAGTGTDGQPWYRGTVNVDWATADAGGSELDDDSAASQLDYQLADGIHTLEREICDNAGNCIDRSVEVRVDGSGPLLTISGVPQGGTVNWSQPLPVLSCVATDPHSGVDSSTCGRTGGPTDQPDGSRLYVYTYTATDRAGNPSSSTVTFRVLDDLPPVIDGVTDRDPVNAAGWFNAPVNILWTYEDDPDGFGRLAESPPASEPADEGVHDYLGEVVDLAGNRASDTVTVKLDSKAPVVKTEVEGEELTGTPLLTKWFNDDVLVRWTTVRDDPKGDANEVSGLDPVRATATDTLTEEGVHTIRNAAGTLCDNAENCAEVEVTVRIDRTRPTVTPSVFPGPLVNGWYNTSDKSVMVSWTPADEEGGSGLDSESTTVEGDPVDGEGVHTVAYPIVTDIAGNDSLARSLEIKIDATAPKITGTGYDPDTTYEPGAVPTVIGCTADDTVAGIETSGVNGPCQVKTTPTIEPGGPDDEGGVLYLVYTATASDFAGNVAEVPLRIKVRALNTGGRMTGGGTLPGGLSVAFTLRCNGSPNTLSVTGGGEVFHLETMRTAGCWLDTRFSDPAMPRAAMNTFVGFGEGSLADGTRATVRFTFIDGGEPGTKDHGTVQLAFRRNGVDRVIDAKGFVSNGNFQANQAQGGGTNANGDLNDPGGTRS